MMMMENTIPGARTLCGLVALFFAIFLQTCAIAQGASGEWDEFKRTFLSEDGRIIDVENQAQSHSEGQGYGLLLAYLHGDQGTFEKIWRWTKDNLQRRKDDHLLCWSWGKRPNGKWQVIDYNNATDGDVVTAYALLLGAKRWGNPAYRDAALGLIRDIRTQLGISWGEYVLLLPGYTGFVHGDELTLNPSYMFLDAYRLFALVDDKVFWEGVLSSSKKILDEARFSTLQLPSDWIVLKRDGAIRPLPGRGEFFGLEAIRVFLFGYHNSSLSSHKRPLEYRRMEQLGEWITARGSIPRSINIKDGCASLEEAPAAYYKIFARHSGELGLKRYAQWFEEKASKLFRHEKKAYYTYALYLLAENLK